MWWSSGCRKILVDISIQIGIVVSMNIYRGWTIEFYAGHVPERVYSAKQHDRKSGETVTLYAPNRAEIERRVDAYIQQHEVYHPIDIAI